MRRTFLGRSKSSRMKRASLLASAAAAALCLLALLLFPEVLSFAQPLQVRGRISFRRESSGICSLDFYHRTASTMTSFVAQQPDGRCCDDARKRLPAIALSASPTPDTSSSSSSSSEFEEDGASGTTVAALRQSDRRRFLSLSAASLALILLMQGGPKAASARGLVQFPCARPLANSYHLMRAGTTLLEEEGMWSTNPLFLTNRDDALSPAGEEQVVAACQLLKQGTRPPTLVKYSLAASSIDTSNIVGRELKLGRDRLVPEFTFLDPRAVGAWDMSARETTLPAVFALDNDEAGTDGLQGRPPANEDGTPHEVLAEQAIRLRQVMSVLESQYSGDTILLIFPDGTGPALLSAMIAGIPYNRVHELEFGPGEVRCDVTMDSTLALWKTKQLEEGEAFQAILKQGRENLKQLRATAKSGGTVVNLKDKKIEEERREIDVQMKEKELKRIEVEKNEQELRFERQREVEAQRGEGVSGVSLTALVAATVAVISGASLGAGTDRQQASAAINNVTELDASGGPPVVEPILELNAVAGAGLYAPTSGNRRVAAGGGNFAGTTIETILDPKEAAERAMEDYMNKDDGADEWLMSLSQIIEEPEVNEDEGLAPQVLSKSQLAAEPKVEHADEALVSQVEVTLTQIIEESVFEDEDTAPQVMESDDEECFQ